MPDVRFVLFDAFGMGGTVRITLETASALAANGVQVEVVSMVQSRPAPSYQVAPNVRITALAYSRHGDRRSPLWRRLHPLRQFLTRVPSILVSRSDSAYGHFSLDSDIRALRWFARLNGGTVVGTRLGLNVMLSRMKRINRSVALCLQEHTYLGSHSPRTRRVIRRRYRAADWVTTLTHADAAAYRRFLKTGRARVAVISNSLPELDYRTSPRTSKVVLTVARLSAEKGIDLLIDAFATVVASFPDWRLHIVGTGALRGAILDQIYRLDLHNNVFLMGGAEDVTTYYEQASIYVQPSRFEGFGLSIVEAMRSALPVVAFDCPVGPREIITANVDGYLVPAEDTSALANAIMSLIREPEVRDSLAVAGAARAEQFRITNTIKPWGRIVNVL